MDRHMQIMVVLAVLCLAALGLIVWAAYELTARDKPAPGEASFSSVFMTQRNAYREKRLADRREKVVEANEKLEEEKREMMAQPAMAPPKIQFDLASLMQGAPPGVGDAPHFGA